MDLHPAVTERIARLAPDQRAAATAEPGPILCIAPAGSGKTTTLVARVAWLVASRAAEPAEIAVISFNRNAADELTERLAPALEPLGVAAGAVRVRTFHALGLEILRDAGVAVDPLVDRTSLLRRLFPAADPGARMRLDTAFSRLKLNLGVGLDEVAADPAPGPIARAFVAYERALAATGGLDFDDLVARALRRLEADASLLHRWRGRSGHLLVDEAQDLDRAQVRLALLLAAPGNRIFLVGDDDQSIYGWRLADVRRLLALDTALPGLRRVDLVMNYRCPAAVIDRSVRLIEHNLERFAKVVRARSDAAGTITLAGDGSDETIRLGRVLAGLPADGSVAVLARTNRELLPVIAAAIDRELPFRPPAIELLVESPLVDEALDAVESLTDRGRPLLVRVEAVRAAWSAAPQTDDADGDDGPSAADIAAALLGWAVGQPDLPSLRAAVAARRAAVARLCRDDARLTLATAHGTKGLEFDHVAVIGLDAGRFPSRRSVTSAADPARAMEEERRLAYVAWTRARRTLTLLYDPASPSPFLLEAFGADELGLRKDPRAA